MSFTIGFVLFDDITQLDFTGPLQFLCRIPDAKAVLVAKSLDPIQTDCGPFILPTHTLENCPDLDLICVPGGFGVDAVMEDPAYLDFLRQQAETAKYVTSVCTGAFILGAAGLLDGVKATTHWRYHEYLSRFGALPVKDRVVRDGRVITGGGVTAGVDFGLTVVKELAGDGVAAAIQLGLEYDPAPPLNAGHPDHVPAPIKDAVEQRFAPRVEAFAKVVDRLTASQD